MRFLAEPPPQYGTPLPDPSGATRIVAPNPSPMTYHGTNTWLLPNPDGTLTLVDPGPIDAAHLAATLRAAAGRIGRILLTHGHADHAGNAAALHAATGAPIHAAAPLLMPGTASSIAPHHTLVPHAMLADLRVLATPGHTADHVCLAWHDGVVLTGDHVMGWASSAVTPPDGDMRAYIASLRLLLEPTAHPHTRYLSGHGPAIPNPQSHVRGLLAHRLRRERAILWATRTPSTTASIARTLYGTLAPALQAAAAATVQSHLAKLQQDRQVTHINGLWHHAPPH